MSAAGELLDVEGPAAPPRRNGELVFEAPWQSRVFGVTMALHARGTFEWDDFRRRLITAIGRAEAAGSFSYYACWLEALEHLLADQQICLHGELDRLAHELAERAAGHDHR